MAAAPATSSEFLDLVRKSAVVEEKRLDAHLQKLRAGGHMPTEPSKLAGIFVRDGVLTHFQAEQLMRGKWNGFSLGKYKVLESLGSGGMGRVYLCEHKLMRRRVAVKILPPNKASEEAVLQRFLREARAAAAVDHPNIVHAYDIDQHNEYHFLVMEYVDGASLQEIVKKTGPLDIGRAAHYIRQSALGLEHAHSMKLIHRDIKPGNILVDRSGLVKLLDMGLARFFDDTDDILTKKYDENVLGTADYLAPEQALDSHEVDIRADIYSLGATFYFLLVGAPPFGDGTVAQKLLWHQTRQPKPLTDLRKDVPPALAAIIEKMMAKDKEHRYQRPGEIVEALTPWTQTPIGPPTDAELPHLSLAATGGAPPSSSGDPTVVSSRGSSGSSHRSFPARPSTGPATPVSGSRSNSAAPSVQLEEAPAQVAEEELEDVAWENVTSDTEDPSARVDTTPGSHQRVIKSNEAKARAKEQRKLRSIFTTVTLLGLVGLGAALALFYLNRERAGPAGPQKWIVAREAAGKPFHFARIGLALEQAGARDIIEIHDPVHEESLVLDRKNATVRSSHVIIQPAPGLKVVWRPRMKSEHRPILIITGSRDIIIKGITFDGTIDDKRRADTLIRVSSENPGLVLEDLDFQNFGRHALFVVNSAGEADQPIKLRNLRSASGPKGNKPFFFDALPQTRPPQNDFIEIDGIDPTLLGRKSNAVNGKDVTWPGE